MTEALDAEGAAGDSTKSSRSINYIVILIGIFITRHPLTESGETRPNHHDPTSRTGRTRAPLPPSPAFFGLIWPLGSLGRVDLVESPCWASADYS